MQAWREADELDGRELMPYGRWLRLDTSLIQPYGCISVQIVPPGFDRVFAALADHTRRDIVRRAISAEEGVLELASHYPMSFAAVQKHVAVLERAGLIVRTNLETLLVARRLLDQYEELWRARVDRMNELIAETAGAIDTVKTKESKR
jgi:DNA-binding transcriptional ArsR family regulator